MQFDDELALKQHQHNVRLGSRKLFRQLPNDPDTRFNWYFQPRDSHNAYPVDYPSALNMPVPEPLYIVQVTALHRGTFSLRSTDGKGDVDILYEVDINVTNCSRVHVLGRDDTLVLNEPTAREWLHLMRPITWSFIFFFTYIKLFPIIYFT